MSDYRYNISDDVMNTSEPDDLEGDHLVVGTNLYVLLFVLWPLAIVTILGNALAVWAYVTDERIRSKITNRYIFYLSISDLTVGCVSMPLNNVWLHFGRWPLGEVTCKIWLVVDYAACYISVMAILLLSFDRFMWVSWPMRYKRRQTPRKATVLILLTAIFAFLFYTIPILFWSVWVGETRIDYAMDCEPENGTNFIYGTIFSLFETIFPAIAISIFNILVYRKIRQVCLLRQKSIRGLDPSKPPETRKQRQMFSQRKSNHTICPRNLDECDTLDPSLDSRHLADAMTPGKSTRCAARMEYKTSVVQANPCQGANFPKYDTSYVIGYRKAGKMLSCMVAVFMFCWTPYNIALLASALCAENCIRNVTWEAVNYLLWANSTINPLLYVLTNERYKRRMLGVFHGDIRRKASCKLKYSTSTL